MKNELKIGGLYKMKEARLAYQVGANIQDNMSFAIKENEIITYIARGTGGRHTFLHNNKLIHFFTLVLQFNLWLEEIS